jgi:hypothetical protein
VNWRAWLAAAAILLAVVGAFLAGRFSRNAGEPQQAVNTSTAADRRAIRDRVVLAALGDHLDRTERALVELVNTDADGTLDISAEQSWARDLLEANRLYRQSARNAGSLAIASLLDDLEPVLLDIVHSPSTLSADEFHALRARIEDRSLVFKLRVTGADVRAPADPDSSRREDVMIASLIAALLVSGTPSTPAERPDPVGIVTTDDAQETEQALYNNGIAARDKSDWDLAAETFARVAAMKGEHAAAAFSGVAMPSTSCRATTKR